MPSLTLTQNLAESIQMLADKNGQTPTEVLLAMNQYVEFQLHNPTPQHQSDYLQGILDSHIDFICRYLPDTTLTYVNDAYCQFFGKTRPELIGSSFMTLDQEAQVQAVHERIAQVANNPTLTTQMLSNTNRDGKKQWIQWVDSGITDETGTVIEIQSVGRDITQLIETQKKLAAREELLSSIFDHIPVLLAQIDGEGHFDFVNQHWVDVLGWTVDELPNYFEALAELYPDPQQRQEALDYFNDAQPGWRDFVIQTNSGNRADISRANVQLSDGSTISIGVDITQRKQLDEQKLYARQLEVELEKERQLTDLKDRFISIVSHEFRTPLAVMKTSIDLITHYFDRLSQEQVLQKFSTVDDQIQRMVYLMEDTLSFSKIKTDTVPQAPSEIEICAFCQKIVDTIHMIDDGNHQIILVCDDGTLRANPKQLDHVFSNLLANALKYSPDNTVITVSVTREGEQWRISIQDEGIGIPQGDIDTLFEPFQRASNVGDIPGTGLGLSIVKDYIEKHKGTIAVESTVGKGSLFTVSLPA